ALRPRPSATPSAATGWRCCGVSGSIVVNRRYGMSPNAPGSSHEDRGRGGEPRHPGRPVDPGAGALRRAPAGGLRGRLRSDQPAVPARARLGPALPLRADRAEPVALSAEPPPAASSRRRPRLLGVVLVVPDRGGAGTSGGASLSQANLVELPQRPGRRPSRALGHARPSLARARPRD